MRLTTHDKGRQPYVITANERTWREIYDKLAAYEDTGFEPEEVAQMGNALKLQSVMVNEASHYWNLQQQGRLVILPCKVGDTFFFLSETIHGELYAAQSRVSDIVITGDALMLVDSDGCYHYTYWFTREEAEAALKGETEDV